MQMQKYQLDPYGFKLSLTLLHLTCCLGYLCNEYKQLSTAVNNQILLSETQWNNSKIQVFCVKLKSSYKRTFDLAGNWIVTPHPVAAPLVDITADIQARGVSFFAFNFFSFRSLIVERSPGAGRESPHKDKKSQNNHLLCHVLLLWLW